MPSALFSLAPSTRAPTALALSEYLYSCQQRLEFGRNIVLFLSQGEGFIPFSLQG